MQQEQLPLLRDPRFWISVGSLAVAALAAFNSWRARLFAARALSISEAQEQRRRPQLGIYQADGYRRHLPNRQLFGFLVSVSNPTDTNNSVVQAELQVTYPLDGGIEAICRVPHNRGLAETGSGPSERAANVFSFPARIDAHQTVAGWLMFSIDHTLIKGRTIDSHRIILEDSHGETAETEPILVRDWTSEEPGS
jgi:hypothetical protein